jgi:hypothetical protein
MPDRSPRATIIVLNYNGDGVIEQCLRSVTCQKYPNFETLVVDNRSSDGSVDTIRRFRPPVRLIENLKNLGYTGGINSASLETSNESELLAIVTNDVVLSPDWLRSMVQTFSDDNSIGMVSSRVYEKERNATITELRVIYPLGTLYVPWNKQIGRLEIDSPTGQAFAVRRQAFKSVGGFDPDYFAYYDEVDLGWRIRLQGYRIMYDPRACVIHEGSHSFRRLPSFVPQFLSERNRMLSCVKNLALASLMAFIVAETFNLVYRAFRGIVSKRWRVVDTGYTLGLIGFLRLLRRALEKRTLVQRSRTLRDREIFSASLPQIMEPLSQKELVFRCVLDVISRILPAS